MTARIECPYCGTTHGLRIKSTNPRTGEVDAICVDCFTQQDDGPCFDDLEQVAVPAIAELRAADCNAPEDWARWARERAEYENPYGYNGRRY